MKYLLLLVIWTLVSCTDSTITNEDIEQAGLKEVRKFFPSSEIIQIPSANNHFIVRDINGDKEVIVCMNVWSDTIDNIHICEIKLLTK